MAGEVIGRRHFGVFLRIDGVPDVVGLTEITAMPREAELPNVGARVTGEVLWHAEHKCQT
ncbi:hypothetical protein ACWGIU_09720 [Streptomyces sp. NPDC054840]